MDTTDWDKYGTGACENCADCTAHSGNEATVIVDVVRHPLKVARVALTGPKLQGAIVPEIPLDNPCPADHVFSYHVRDALAQIHE